MAATMGVPQLDKILGPIPDHTAVLFVNDPGVEAEPFLYQVAASTLRGGGRVVYVVTNRSPSSVVKSMGEYGFTLEDPSKLHFVDAFSGLLGTQDEAAYTVDDPMNLQQLALTLEKAAQEHPDAIVLVDSLSSLIDVTSMEAFKGSMPRLKAAMRRFKLSASLFTTWPYAGETDDILGNFEAVVRLRGVEDRVLVSQYFAVERASWNGSVDGKPRLYKLVAPEGVCVYIPKIVVTGPYNAGKSTLVHTLSDQAVSVDRLGTTVAIDHGRVTIDGLVADIFGTPGQSRFDPILKQVASQALGVIVVVDSTKPATFPRARQMLEQIWSHGLPAIIAANKQDLPHALAPEDVARAIETPGHVKVVGCLGDDRASARKVLQELIDQILEKDVRSVAP